MNSPECVNSVKVAIRVLEAVAATDDAGVSELARKLAAPKTTIQRALNTLHQLEWLSPIRGTRKRWRLGSRLRAIPTHAPKDALLRLAALRPMERLRLSTRETIHLAIPDGKDIILIERLDSLLPLQAVRPVGLRIPLHACSNGKTVLAAMQEEELAEYMSGPLRAWTRYTITDVNALSSHIRATCALGYAVNLEETYEGFHAVAAPIRSNGGHTIASISISCPSMRLPASRQSLYGRMVAQAATSITTELWRLKAVEKEAAKAF